MNVITQAVARGEAALEQPDMFTRSIYIVTEIEDAVLGIVGQAVKLKVGRETKDAAAMRAALAEIATLQVQSSNLCLSLDRVLAAGR